MTQSTDLPQMTALTGRQFTTHVSSRHHAMAGAVIALAAAQAAALGEVCMRITRDHLDDPSAQQQADDLIDRVTECKQQLLDLTDTDGSAITAFVALREAGQELAGQDMLCALPVDMGELAFQGASALQAFRPLVIDQVHDDLEMALTLLTGATQACTLLLDSNLRIWPDPTLIAKYEPLRASLEANARQLTPVARLRAP
jgi:formiminotetrahydrofolate cyclodeaminase